MKVVKSAYSRKPATKSIKASDDADTFVDETLELEPNDLLLTVDDAAELVSQVASDIAGEEVAVETQIADDAESVDFIVNDEVYTATPEEDDDVVVSAKLLNGKVKIVASKKPATRQYSKPTSAVLASREAAARRRRIAMAKSKMQGK